MGFDLLTEVHKEVSCKPDGMSFEYQYGCFSCGPLTCLNQENHVWYVEACLIRKDTHTDTLARGYGGKIAIPNHAEKDTIIKKFFVAARDYAEHEVREAFLWRGKRVLSPHMPLDQLWETMGDDI